MSWFMLVLMAVIGVGDDPQADQYLELGGDFAASHILIAYKGAERAPAEVARSKAEALTRATEIADRLRQDPSQFETLALESDDKAAPKGYMGGFKKGAMASAFEKALVKLEEGMITREPVKTQFGYHIIRRDPLLVKRYAARILLLTDQAASKVNGLKPEAPGLTRDKQASTALAQQLADQLTPENFVAMAETQSDLSRTFLGSLKEGDANFSDQVIAAIRDLPYGAIAPLQDLSIGLVFLQRVKMERRAGARILIAIGEGLRSEPEAASLAASLSQQLQVDPDKFADIARKYSDEPSGKQGGKLPPWVAGDYEQVLEDAYSALAEGTVGRNAILTSKGYYLIRRDTINTSR